MSEDNAAEFNLDFLKDVADIVKNKTLFFIPLFGAYLAFMVGKTDYIKAANPVIWLFCATIFAVSVRYIHLVSQLLWAMESSRIIFNFRKIGIDPFLDKEKDITAFSDLVKLIPKMYAAEDWWFKKFLFPMYMASFCVFVDLFFGKFLNEQLIKLIGAILK